METTTVNDRKPATPEEIWAILREVSESQKKTDLLMQENAQRHKELDLFIKETDRQMKETDAKFDKMQKNLGGLNNSVGYLIETLVAARLWEKFPEYNLQRAYRPLPIYDENNQPKTDIDILLVNSEWAMAVEVKHEVDVNEVNRHIVRMARILQYPPAQLVPGIKLLGAMAGGLVTPDAAAYAHQCGFFALELAGESVIRLPAPAGFQPKEWQKHEL